MRKTRCYLFPLNFADTPTHTSYVPHSFRWFGSPVFFDHIGGHALAHGHLTKSPPVLPVAPSDKLWRRMATKNWPWNGRVPDFRSHLETRSIWKSFEFWELQIFSWMWCCLKHMLKQWTRIWVRQFPLAAANLRCSAQNGQSNHGAMTKQVWKEGSSQKINVIYIYIYIYM